MNPLIYRRALIGRNLLQSRLSVACYSNKKQSERDPTEYLNKLKDDEVSYRQKGEKVDDDYWQGELLDKNKPKSSNVDVEGFSSKDNPHEAESTTNKERKSIKKQ